MHSIMHPMTCFPALKLRSAKNCGLVYDIFGVRYRRATGTCGVYEIG